MFAVGQQDIKKIDAFTIEQLGLPGVVLMENAGARVVEEIQSLLQKKAGKVLLFAGGGNNGGDGFVIARRLHDLGIDALLCLLVPPQCITGDAKVHFQAYVQRKLPFFHLDLLSLDALENEIEQADILVDAMIGTGVKGALRSPFKEVISLINQFVGKKTIIAVDIPSGVQSDTGRVESVAVQATKTVTFVYPKMGFFLNQGPNYIGDWKAVDISVPPHIVDDLGLILPIIVTPDLIQSIMPVRPTNGHKGTFGHALVIGGAKKYVGAPIFSAKAALASGVGLVTLAVPECNHQVAATLCPEALLLALPDEEGHIAPESVYLLREQLATFKSVAIGPGLSRFVDGDKWIRTIIDNLQDQPLVIDADGLYQIRHQLDIVKNYDGPVIITPHPGEMAMLVQKTVAEVEDNRLEIAKKIAETYQLYVLLKGHRSVIATPSGAIYINPYGNDALAKGGSGDVLTGIIVSFLAQGFSPEAAVICACYLHARAGEEQAKSLSHYGVLPGDLIDGVKNQLIEIG